MRESACKLVFAMVCIIRLPSFPHNPQLAWWRFGRSPLDTSSVWHKAQTPSNYYHYYYYYYYHYYYYYYYYFFIIILLFSSIFHIF